MTIDIALIVITLGGFLAAFVNAAFATGGVYIVLLSSISVLPVSAAIPLQFAFSVSSLFGRVFFFWKDINWSIVRTFALGCLIGVALGTVTFASLPDQLISLLLGFVLLLMIWLPKMPNAPRWKRPFLYIGIVHSYISAVFGVGGILQPAILRTDMRKTAITGTLAACMLAMEVMKTSGYLSIGFDYTDYIPHIICANIAGFLGVWAGKRVTHLISEQTFRTFFKLFVSLVALRLIWRGLGL